MGWRDHFWLPGISERRSSFEFPEAVTAENWDSLSKEQRAVLPWNVYGDEDVGTKTTSGARVSEDIALKQSVVYASVTLIADGVASLAPMAFTMADDGTKTRQTIPQWIRKPHPEIRRFDVWNQLMVSVLAWGNAYARFIRRPSDGVIIGLMPIDPSTMETEWDPNKPGYRRYREGGSRNRWESSYEIFHIQGPTLPGAAKGMSVISYAREAIGLGMTLEEYGARYFGQGSQAKVVIEIPQGVNENQAKDIVKTFERFHRGKLNWHRPAIMSGGGKLHQITIPPDDAQFLESRDFQAVEIARWFRVPPHRVGIINKSTSWGSGLAEENMAMLQHTFRPWILRMEGALTAYAPGGEDRGLLIKLGDDVLQRGTFKEAADTWSMLVEKGLATPDEGRVKLGLKPMGGEAAKLRDPNAQPDMGGGGAPRSKEDDRIRKQDEAAGRSRREKDVLESHYRADARHLPGKHDQSTHGHGGKMVETGTTYDSLGPKGKAAVDAWYGEMGVTHEGMVAEIEGKLNPEAIAGGKAWYQEARDFNQRVATESGLSVAQTTAITAAVSPLNPWPTNMAITERIAMKHRDFEGVVPTYRNKQGVLDTPDQARGRAMGGYLSQPMGIGFGIARLRGKDGGPPSDDQIHEFIDKNLTGTKRRSFYNNMLDPVNSQDITVDTWMTRVAINSSKKPGGVKLEDAKVALGRSKKSTNGAGAGYVGISDAVRAVAKKTGLHPHEVQAAYWIEVSGSPLGATGT